MTVKAQDLSLGVDFTFKSTITGNLNGFAIWFDVDFDNDEEPIKLRTGPEDP